MRPFGRQWFFARSSGTEFRKFAAAVPEQPDVSIRVVHIQHHAFVVHVHVENRGGMLTHHGASAHAAVGQSQVIEERASEDHRMPVTAAAHSARDCRPHAAKGRDKERDGTDGHEWVVDRQHEEPAHLRTIHADGFHGGDDR